MAIDPTMKTTPSIGLALAMLLPASLRAADEIRIETRIVESDFTKIPHDLAGLAKLKGVDVLTAPSITTRFSESGKVEILRDHTPPSATDRKFEPSATGVAITVTPERQGADIAFKGCLTITELVGEATATRQAQSETITRTIHFSGKQKEGDDGWFDFINPTDRSPKRKIAVCIRFARPNTGQAVDPNGR